MTVMNPITPIPRMRAANCFIDSIRSSSWSRSGKTVTRAMWRNPPAVNGMIQEVLASIADVTPDPPMATKAPRRPAVAVRSCALAASHLENPDRRRIAKSPTSCGISCSKMANVANTPCLNDTKNDPATASPWVKLSIEFASRFKYPATFFGCSRPFLFFSDKKQPFGTSSISQDPFGAQLPAVCPSGSLPPFFRIKQLAISTHLGWGLFSSALT